MEEGSWLGEEMIVTPGVGVLTVLDMPVTVIVEAKVLGKVVVIGRGPESKSRRLALPGVGELNLSAAMEVTGECKVSEAATNTSEYKVRSLMTNTDECKC